MRKVITWVVSFSKTVYGAFITLIVFLASLVAVITFALQVPSLWKEFNKKDTTTVDMSEKLPCQDLFKDSINYKIVVLPFFKTCETGRDVGLEIRNRLLSLKYKDSLSIDVCYLDSYKQDANFTKDKAEKLRLNYKADQIIYGVNSSLNCTPQDTLLEVCVNYITNVDDPSIKQVPIGKTKASLSDIQQGFLQANIDNIVYFFSAISDKNRGNYTQSLSKLRKMRNVDLNSDFYYLKGSVHEKLNDYDSALVNYNMAVKYNPTSENYLSRGNLERLYFERYDLAIKDYVLSINSTNNTSQKLKGFFNLSISFYANDEYGKAVKYADTYVKIASNKKTALPNIYKDMATMYVVKGASIFAISRNRDEAIKYYDKALEVAPNDEVALLNKAITVDEKGDVSEALEIYNKLIKIDSSDYSYYINRGGIHYELGDTILSKKDFISALKIGNYSANVYKRLGSKMRDLKENWYALSLLVHAAAINRYDASIYRELADTYVELTLYSEAIKKYNLALVLEPENYDIIYDRASAYYSLGKYDEAISDFSRYIRSNKRFTYRAYYYRAVCKKIIADKSSNNDMRKAASMGMTLAQNFTRAYSDTIYRKRGSR